MGSYSLTHHKLASCCSLFKQTKVETKLRKMSNSSSFSQCERQVIVIGWCLIVIMASIYLGLVGYQIFGYKSYCCSDIEYPHTSGGTKFCRIWKEQWGDVSGC